LVHQITLIPGDGIGPEITKATTRILDHSGVKIDWEVVEAGMTALEKYRDPLPQEVARVIEKSKKVTKDINSNNFVGTAEFADAVIEEL
jgi:isocitrate dehydrogenase (NAD+)